MSTLDKLVFALRAVSERLELHIERDKHTRIMEHWADMAALGECKAMLFNADHVMGTKTLLAMTTVPALRAVLRNATERLRLYVVNHPYPELRDTENELDREALDDANSILLNPEVNYEEGETC